MLTLRRTTTGFSRPNLLRRMVGAMALRRQRSRLAQLDDHILRDIGIDRAAAEIEAARPIWDVPGHWHR